MKLSKLSLAFLFLFLTALIITLNGCSSDVNPNVATSASPETISWVEGIDHIGEKHKVFGQVISVNHNPNDDAEPTILNVGKTDPDPDRFLVIIPGAERDNFDRTPESYYVGKVIEVEGKIAGRGDLAAITVHGPEDINEYLGRDDFKPKDLTN